MGTFSREDQGCRKLRPFVLIVLLTGILAILLTSCARDLSTEQKLEDFRYLFEIIRDNHPYIELKARVEGYDWLEHEKEFEDAVRASRNDRSYVDRNNDRAHGRQSI